MKQKLFIWTKQVSSVIWAAVLVLTMIGVLTMPLAVSKYTAQGQGQAKARIASFDIISSTGSFGTDAMIYFHKQFAGDTGYVFRIDITNTSEVAVRLQLRFYNVFQNDGTYASNFNWTNASHRRLLNFPVTNSIPNIFNTDASGNGTRPTVGIAYSTTHYPRISFVRTADLGDTDYPNTDRRYYSLTSGQEGPLVLPGETIRIKLGLHGQFYRSGTTTNIHEHNVTGTTQDAQHNAVFRINYDIIATQVD